MSLFNDFIGDLHLIEIHVSGVRFTWSNKQHNPTLVKLNRILASTCWDLHYASCYAWSKAKVGSNHSPLILDTREHRENKSKYFYFQERWFQYEGFGDLVKGKWEETKVPRQSQSYSLDRWHGCLQSLRQYLRGWNLRKVGEQKETKLNISKRIEAIDLIAEERLLSMDEWEERIALEGSLEEVLKWDELPWKQKVGRNWVLQGDANTHFFHQFVNGRRRKNFIAFYTQKSGKLWDKRKLPLLLLTFTNNSLVKVILVQFT